LLEAAIATFLKHLGEDHVTVAASRANLAEVCIKEGDLTAALHLFEQAVASYAENLGADHPATSGVRAGLARVFYKLGQLDRAREEARRARAGVATQPEGSRHRVLVEQAVGNLNL
jgi:tetratricopeptide (TPR) repeat protein